METMLTTSVDSLVQRDAFWWLIGIVFGLLVLALILDARDDHRRSQGMTHKTTSEQLSTRKRSSDDDIVFYDPALYAGTSMVMDDSSSSCDFDSGDAGDCGGAD